MLDFELNSIHLVRLSYKTRQRCKAIFHFLSESGFGDVKNGEKTIGTPSKRDFSGEGQKIGAFLVQLFGYKKSRKRLFINDLRLSFCGERGI